jgi:hypothetical protein
VVGNILSTIRNSRIDIEPGKQRLRGGQLTGFAYRLPMQLVEDRRTVVPSAAYGCG